MSEPKQTPINRTGTVVPFKAATEILIEAAPEAFPAFTWKALEQQLADLSVTPRQRALVQTLMSATRKQAAFKPAELVLREVLCIASVLMDESFHTGSTPPNARPRETDASDLEEGGMT